MFEIILAVAVIAAVILADQISKVLIVARLYEDSVTLIPHVLRFSYVENRGMAFGMLAEHRWVFLVLATLGIALVTVYLFRFARGKLARVSLALIVGGGIGNMIDRVARGFVVDFIDFCAFPDLWYWVFNVADAAVCVGAGLVILWLILDMVREGRAKKNASAPPAGNAETNPAATEADAGAETPAGNTAEPPRKEQENGNP